MVDRTRKNLNFTIEMLGFKQISNRLSTDIYTLHTVLGLKSPRRVRAFTWVADDGENVFTGDGISLPEFGRVGITGFEPNSLVQWYDTEDEAEAISQYIADGSY